MFKDKLFNNQVFDSNVIDKDYEIENDITFIDCLFKREIRFTTVKASQLIFTNCRFEDHLDIATSSFTDIKFSDCKFLREVRVNSGVTLPKNRTS